MRTNFRLVHIAVTLVLLSCVATVSAQVYGGRAIGVTAAITTTGTANFTSTDTGQLPGGGGVVNSTSPSFTIPGTLSTAVLTSSASGALRSSQATSVVGNVVFTAGGVTVTAVRVTANTNCICCPEATVGACTGSTSILGLVVTDSAGTRNIPITGDADQEVTFDLGTLTINEQNVSVSQGAIEVTGLHIEAQSGGTTYDIRIAQARSNLDCLSTTPSAGPVTVSGRALTSAGRPISRAVITLTDEKGTVRTVTTSSMGYFTFEQVPSGFTYILNASHRQYEFTPQVIGLNDNLAVTLTAN